MPHIDVCIVWHMHQPFYKDLVRGEYKLPWTRLHGLKDYYGMVQLLAEFPKVRQTFNLVPSMLVQVEDYASGQADDPFLRLALQPAETLTEAEKQFLLQYFFQANVDHLIHRYPRYAELYQSRTRPYSVQDYRDLQVLSQLAWVDEFFLTGDAEIAALAKKGRDYSLDDQALLGRKQTQILGEIIPVYRRFAAAGQIEISTTPFYHPILPLICDSNIAGVSNHGVPLPTRFRYPQDARVQLQRARDYMERQIGVAPRGLWPSEGSVSDEALSLAAECGFEWFATDNGVLSRTLGRDAGVVETYRPYLWQQGDQKLHGIFRDHYLSDLVGFTYSKMGPEEAADHLISRIVENAGGRDALVPVILDGENAWEYFPESGREFLRQLYRRLESTPNLSALTVSEALQRHTPTPLTGIFPGSWISANFDVWIGFDEDNRAWEQLLRARQTYDKYNAEAKPEDRELAFEELLIAEGSDWCWWYGPHHESANRVEFDQLFRDHLSNVYRLLGQPAPEELGRPILRISVAEHNIRPSTRINPVIDGEVTSYFEWMGAGEYKVDQRQGAMHGGRSGLAMLYYGTNGSDIFIRCDFEPAPEPTRLELRLRTERADYTLRPSACAFHRILEASIPVASLGYQTGETVPFQLSLWLDSLPAEALPQNGWLEIETGDHSHWP
ncbi:MAG TPA: glycoside hydrolase family 57 protein [Bryobacteraceae bacterium]|nr:glycoside hydrolase family 57 protein [Bryobacteraceae bacterium]